MKRALAAKLTARRPWTREGPKRPLRERRDPVRGTEARRRTQGGAVCAADHRLGRQRCAEGPQARPPRNGVIWSGHTPLRGFVPSPCRQAGAGQGALCLQPGDRGRDTASPHRQEWGFRRAAAWGPRLPRGESGCGQPSACSGTRLGRRRLIEQPRATRGQGAGRVTSLSSVPEGPLEGLLGQGPRLNGRWWRLQTRGPQAARRCS